MRTRRFNRMKCGSHFEICSRTVLNLWLLVIPCFAFPQSGSDKAAFLEKVQSCHMQFTTGRSGYHEVRVNHNPGIAYDYAIADPGGRYEIRYKISPEPQNNAVMNTSGTSAAQFYKLTMTALCFDLSHDHNLSYQDFPSGYLRTKMNAEQGGKAFLKPTAEFSGSLWNCYLLSYYKRGSGFIDIFYLFNALDTATLGHVVAATYDLVKFLPGPTAPSGDPANNLSAATDQRLLKLYKDSLKTTDVQADSLVAINKRYAMWSAAVKGDSSMAKKDKIIQLLTFVREKDGRIKKLLSSDQYAIWERWHSEHFSKGLAAYSN